MSSLWRRLRAGLRGPVQRPANGRARTHAREGNPPKVSEANELRAATLLANIGVGFWTGVEIHHDRDRFDKLMRIAQGNSHLLHAIWTLVSAQLPSEIECPNCLATIRAPYAEEVVRGPAAEG